MPRSRRCFRRSPISRMISRCSVRTSAPILEFTVGGVPMAPYLPLLEEELAYRGEDRRAPGWQLDELAPGVDFRVLIIGAGMSGLLTAHRLQQAGVPFLIVDKNAGVGGTRWENTY